MASQQTEILKKKNIKNLKNKEIKSIATLVDHGIAHNLSRRYNAEVVSAVRNFNNQFHMPPQVPDK